MVFRNKDIIMILKIRLLRCYVFSVLFYGMEAGTQTENISERLEAFELQTYRRILRISWVYRVTNAEVLRRQRKEKEVLNTMTISKLQYLGHVIRRERYNLLQLIMHGRIQKSKEPRKKTHLLTKQFQNLVQLFSR